MKKATILLALLLFAALQGAIAQNTEYKQMIDNATVEYLRIAGSQSPLYQGRVQEGHSHTTNHPYLKYAQYENTRLSYFGIIYPNAALRLDLSRDELVILSPDFRNIVLLPENVDFAELHGKHIIYFYRNSLPGSPSTGYYSLLHSENCKVIEKQTAKLMTDSRTGTQYYVVLTNFYLLKDGVYYAIQNQRGLLRVLQPYKKELNRFISSNNLRFRHDAERLITQTDLVLF